jgi:hypothetical protein
MRKKELKLILQGLIKNKKNSKKYIPLVGLALKQIIKNKTIFIHFAKSK